MSAPQRIEILIDIFDLAQQRALALPELTPPQFIKAILQEFTELEYLGNAPEEYQLQKAADKTPLDDEKPLQAQLGDEAHLIPPDGEGMYRQFLADMQTINPLVRVIGLTATPFRMKSSMRFPG